MTDDPVTSESRPLGVPVPGWRPPARPERATIEGQWCRLESLDLARHGDGLFGALCGEADEGLWTYIPAGPFPTRSAFDEVMRAAEAGDEMAMYAVVVDGAPRGVAAFLRCDPAAGSIEVGFIVFGSRLQHTAAATEVIYLLARDVFELGYRRFEWKCNALNAPSRRAAARFGFSYEGTFRQAMVVKGRNRDTAWFSMLDSEWPDARTAFERWLAADNFDDDGQQRMKLGVA